MWGFLKMGLPNMLYTENPLKNHGAAMTKAANPQGLAARAMPLCARPPANKLSSAATSVSTEDHSQLPRTERTSLKGPGGTWDFHGFF